jgi:hypothetical protein
MLYASSVDQMTGREIVRAVEHHAGLGDQLLQQRSVGLLLYSVDLNARIHCGNRSFGRLNLGHADALYGVGHLTL